MGEFTPKMSNISPENKKHLGGQKILSTRPPGGSGQIERILKDAGAELIACPVVETCPVDHYQPLDDAIRSLHKFDWVVFVSRNGIRYLKNRLDQLELELPAFPGPKVACIGQGTAQAFKSWTGLAPQLIPPHSNSRSLAQSLVACAHGQKAIIFRANRGSQDLSRILQKNQLEFQEVVCYLSRDREIVPAEIKELLEKGAINWTTVTSSAIARSAVHLFGPLLKKTRLASLSDSISHALIDLGYPPQLQASTPNLKTMYEEMISFENYH